MRQKLGDVGPQPTTNGATTPAVSTSKIIITTISATTTITPTSQNAKPAP